MTFAARAFSGTRLREARKAKGYSQTRLGKLIGAHVTSVSDWERGDNSPSGRHLASLSRELGVPSDHFFGDDDEESRAVDTNDILVALHHALGQALGVTA